jgi:hypothetical protein
MTKIKYFHVISILLAYLVSSSAGAFGFADKIPSIGGIGGNSGEASSGGASWKQVAKDFQSARLDITREVIIQDQLRIEILDAMGLKKDAEKARRKAKDYENGDVLGTSDLGEIREASVSTDKLIIDKLSEAENLTADQKKALGEIAVKYVPSLLSTIKTAKLIKNTISNVSKLGTPKFTDGKSAISAAKDIPKVGPAIIKLTLASVKQGTKMLSLMNTKGVATPDTSVINEDW